MLVPGPFPPIPVTPPPSPPEILLQAILLGIGLLAIVYFNRREAFLIRLKSALEEVESFLLDPEAELKQEFAKLEREVEMHENPIRPWFKAR